MPSGLNLISKLGSPAITRSVSSARLGYNTPSTTATVGMRLTTPSISGSVETIPAPTLLFSSSGIFAIIPP